MAAWDLDTPLNTILANTIHTAIQAAKTDIMERLRVTNADAVDEHDVFGLTATGAHAISQVGFVKIHTTQTALVTFNNTYFPTVSTLHFTEDNTTLYVKNGVTFTPMITSDHGSFIGLTTLADHSQYLATNGTRTMAGTISLAEDAVLSVATIGEDDDSPIAASHTTSQWYAAHGTNSISTAHFTDACITNINTDNYNRNIVLGLSMLSTYSFVPGMQASASGTTMTLCRDSSNRTQWPSGTSIVTVNLRNLKTPSVVGV